MQTTGTGTTLAHSLNRLTEVAWGGTYAQAFAAAFQFGVFEALNEAQTADDLARRIEIHPVGCRRLLMTLAAVGLVEREGDRFRNTSLGETCSSRSPVNLGAVSLVNPFYHMCEYLPQALRDYEPVWQQALGTTAVDAFGALYADPIRLRQFAEMMDALSIPQGQLIAQSFDFAPYRCVMDVAGGPGGQSIAIGVTHPHLRGIVMDLPPICAIAEERIASAGLSDRYSAVAGDLLAGPYPGGADILLLGHILHDWSDDTCGTILGHCAAALPADGVLLVSESVLDADFSRPHGTHAKDLLMLLANESGARERTEDEYRALLGASGFAIQKVIRLEAPRDLIVATRQ